MTTATDSVNDTASNLGTDFMAGSPQSRLGGAPIGNRSSLRHGLSSVRPGIGISNHAKEQVNKFRQSLEDAVVSEYGEISVLAAKLIHTATEACRVAAANRELLHGLIAKGGDIKPETRLAIDAAYLAALDKCDKKLQELGLQMKQTKEIDHFSGGPAKHTGDLDSFTLESLTPPAATLTPPAAAAPPPPAPPEPDDAHSHPQAGGD